MLDIEELKSSIKSNISLKKEIQEKAYSYSIKWLKDKINLRLIGKNVMIREICPFWPTAGLASGYVVNSIYF